MEISGDMDVRIRFAMLKQMWSIGDKDVALRGLEQLIVSISSSCFNSQLSLSPSSSGLIKTSSLLSNSESESFTQSYLSCLLKLGEWKIAGLLILSFKFFVWIIN